MEDLSNFFYFSYYHWYFIYFHILFNLVFCSRSCSSSLVTYYWYKNRFWTYADTLFVTRKFVPQGSCRDKSGNVSFFLFIHIFCLLCILSTSDSLRESKQRWKKWHCLFVLLYDLFRFIFVVVNNNYICILPCFISNIANSKVRFYNQQKNKLWRLQINNNSTLTKREDSVLLIKVGIPIR